MKLHDSIFLLFAGSVLWIAGTVYFRVRGAAVLETTSLRYGLSLLLMSILTAVLCVAVFWLLHIPASVWASAALLLALPGLFGEVLVLSCFSTFMPKLQAASAGRYGGLLFAAYALVLGIAEAVTLSAAR